MERLKHSRQGGDTQATGTSDRTSLAFAAGTDIWSSAFAGRVTVENSLRAVQLFPHHIAPQKAREDAHEHVPSPPARFPHLPSTRSRMGRRPCRNDEGGLLGDGL